MAEVTTDSDRTRNPASEQGRPLYLVLQKVWTPAECDFPDVAGFWIFRCAAGPGGRRGWLAVRIMTAASWRAAYNTASQDLIHLIDAVHVTLQCTFSTAGASWFVWRQLGDQPYLVANTFRPDPVVPMTLWQEKQLSDMYKLRAVDPAALRYFRESSRASTAKTRLAMLAITAEALAGDGTTVPQCDKCKVPLSCPTCQKQHQYKGTDKAHLETILTTTLYRSLYKGAAAIRHKLMHGDTVDEAKASELARTAYANIRAYLQVQLNLESDLDVNNAPRPLEGTGQQMACVRLNPEWLPSPFNPLSVDWPAKLAQLESKDLHQFGDPMSPPENL